MKKLSGVFICLLLFTFISSARIIEVADAGITDKLKAVIAAKNAPAGGGAPSGNLPTIADTGEASASASGDTLSVEVVTSGSNLTILCFFAYETVSTITSAIWDPGGDSVNLSKIATASIDVAESENHVFIDTWYADDTTGTINDKTENVTATWSIVNTGRIGHCVVLNNSEQVAPYIDETASDTGTPTEITVGSIPVTIANTLLLSMAAINIGGETFVPDTGETLIYSTSVAAGSANGAGSSYLAKTATATEEMNFSWTTGAGRAGMVVVGIEGADVD